LLSQATSEEASDGREDISPCFSLAECSPTPEDHSWLPLLRVLPTRDDLAAANNALQTTIRMDIQALHEDLQELSDRVGRIEATCDQLHIVQNRTEGILRTEKEYLRSMALHVEDLDNRGCRNNLRLRGLPEMEDTLTQLCFILETIFNAILERDL
ncbi:Hypothetical predicted protein, partial [Pelobates cultripes]